MSDSILTSIKKNLGIDEEYEVFDPDVIMYINSAFGTLNQLGIGPELGFAIDDKAAVWDDFLEGDLRLNSVKQYVTLWVRSVFDPPEASYAVTAIKEQLEQLAWRLNVVREGDKWIDPDPTPVPEESW